jgi:hypothetical protein
MQRELPVIDFSTQAEVRAQAEHRRAQEIAGLIKPFFDRWTARFHRKQPIFNAARYLQAAGAGNRGLSSGRS